MLKPGVRILVLALFCSLLLEFAPQLRSQAQSKGTAIVSGRVTLKDEPASGVMVALQPQAMAGRQSSDPALRSRTDSDGNFRITGIAAGRYVVSALAPGLVTSERPAFGQPGGKMINVSEGENIENVNLALKRGGVITGRVVDANGEPLIEETVRLTQLDESGKPSQFMLEFTKYYMFMTDDRGAYRLYGLPAGRYLVSVGHEQREGSFSVTSNRNYYPQTFHPDVTDESKAKIIELGEGEEATGIGITVGEAKKTYDVLGRAVDAETGQPVVGVDVGYGPLRPDGTGMAGWAGMGVRSDPQGNFRLMSVIPGKYAAMVPPREGIEYYGEPVPFEVNNGDVTGVELKVRRGASINGVVAVEGANDPAVLAKLAQLGLSALPTSPMGVRSMGSFSRVTANGSFTFSGLRPGKTRIMLNSMGGEQIFSLLRLERGGVISQSEIEVGAGEQISNLRVVVGYGSAILRGRLQVVGGESPGLDLSSFIVTAHRRGGDATSAARGEADLRGQFTIKGLLPGDYELRLVYFNRSNPSDQNQQLKTAVSQFKQQVTVGSGDQNQVAVTLNLTQREGNQ
ncbi:MAG TPA: carboxypeptidase-like regulatory domain-containing protein [Blastocatellia bacterium]|nr:carboxypeptidase-like regulatory domain-containing protein [Blastocatellia bacterium]